MPWSILTQEGHRSNHTSIIMFPFLWPYCLVRVEEKSKRKQFLIREQKRGPKYFFSSSSAMNFMYSWLNGGAQDENTHRVLLFALKSNQLTAWKESEIFFFHRVQQWLATFSERTSECLVWRTWVRIQSFCTFMNFNSPLFMSIQSWIRNSSRSVCEVGIGIVLFNQLCRRADTWKSLRSVWTPYVYVCQHLLCTYLNKSASERRRKRSHMDEHDCKKPHADKLILEWSPPHARDVDLAYVNAYIYNELRRGCFKQRRTQNTHEHQSPWCTVSRARRDTIENIPGIVANHFQWNDAECMWTPPLRHIYSPLPSLP